MSNERALFVTKLGGILAAVGSAVGLGNIWRFPYETGQNGGAAFLLIYVLCVLMLGTPLMLAELTLGRASHSNAVGAFRRLAPGTYWWVTGFFGAVGVLMIVGFYSVVAGWTLHYTVVSVLDRLTVQDFGAYSQGAWLPFLYMTGFVLLNMLILMGGVQKGIERWSNILMPIMGALMLVLCINSLLLPGAVDGLKFLFHLDFSRITGKVILSAMGQSFFSISMGVGTLLIYGSAHCNLGWHHHLPCLLCLRYSTRCRTRSCLHHFAQCLRADARRLRLEHHLLCSVGYCCTYFEHLDDGVSHCHSAGTVEGKSPSFGRHCHVDSMGTWHLLLLVVLPRVC